MSGRFLQRYGHPLYRPRLFSEYVGELNKAEIETEVNDLLQFHNQSADLKFRIKLFDDLDYFLGVINRTNIRAFYDKGQGCPLMENRFLESTSDVLSQLFRNESFGGLQIDALAVLMIGAMKYGIVGHLCSRYLVNDPVLGRCWSSDVSSINNQHILMILSHSIDRARDFVLNDRRATRSDNYSDEVEAGECSDDDQDKTNTQESYSQSGTDTSIPNTRQQHCPPWTNGNQMHHPLRHNTYHITGRGRRLNGSGVRLSHHPSNGRGEFVRRVSRQHYTDNNRNTPTSYYEGRPPHQHSRNVSHPTQSRLSIDHPQHSCNIPIGSPRGDLHRLSSTRPPDFISINSKRSVPTTSDDPIPELIQSPIPPAVTKPSSPTSTVSKVKPPWATVRIAPWKAD